MRSWNWLCNNILYWGKNTEAFFSDVILGISLSLNKLFVRDDSCRNDAFKSAACIGTRTTTAPGRLRSDGQVRPPASLWVWQLAAHLSPVITTHLDMSRADSAAWLQLCAASEFIERLCVPLAPLSQLRICVSVCLLRSPRTYLLVELCWRATEYDESWASKSLGIAFYCTECFWSGLLGLAVCSQKTSHFSFSYNCSFLSAFTNMHKIRQVKSINSQLYNLYQCLPTVLLLLI